MTLSGPFFVRLVPLAVVTLSSQVFQTSGQARSPIVASYMSPMPSANVPIGHSGETPGPGDSEWVVDTDRPTNT
jgi:hypothetical protein